MVNLTEDLVRRIVAEFPDKREMIHDAVRNDTMLPIMSLLGGGIRSQNFARNIANFKDGHEEVHPKERKARLEDLMEEVTTAILK